MNDNPESLNRSVRVEVEKGGEVANAVIETGNTEAEQWSFQFFLPEPMPEGATPLSGEEAEKLLLERVGRRLFFFLSLPVLPPLPPPSPTRRTAA